MKKKRIGNDIAFAWTIVDKQGNPYSLVGKDLTLTLSSALGCDSVISPFTVGGTNGNVVMWTFYGKDQKTLGKYTATLVENLGDIGMKTVDKIDAIYLVAHTYQEGGEDSCSHLTTETVELESAIETAAKGDPGDPAGFGEVTASVDGGVGTPSVEVTTSGPDTAKNFAFSFHNLKGQDGSDAEVTAQNIQSALGYVPVAPSDISQFITKTVDDLTNYYLKSETYTKAEVEALVAGISGVSFVVANSLPTASASTMGKIYLIPSADPQTQNVKDEFITLESGGSYSWEQIGSTAIDLDGYVTDEDLATALADYVLSSSITDVLRYSSQSLTTEQQTQARTNIGAGTYSKPSGGIPSSDMASAVQTSLGKADSAYQKPSTGIPSTDMASAVQTSLGKADSAYQKPSGGIPSTDLASAVQTSLGKADTAYQKPSGGIPSTDIASGVIPDVSGKEDASNKVTSIDSSSTDTQYPSAKAVFTGLNAKADSDVMATALEKKQTVGSAQDVVDAKEGDIKITEAVIGADKWEQNLDTIYPKGNASVVAKSALPNGYDPANFSTISLYGAYALDSTVPSSATVLLCTLSVSTDTSQQQIVITYPDSSTDTYLLYNMFTGLNTTRQIIEDKVKYGGLLPYNYVKASETIESGQSSLCDYIELCNYTPFSTSEYFQSSPSYGAWQERKMTTTSVAQNSTQPVTSGGVYTALSAKQDTLISGTNIKTINNESILGSGNISIPSAPTEIFWATYGTTTAAEIDAAVSAEKAVMCYYNNNAYFYASKDANYIYFGNTSGETARNIPLNISTNNWGSPSSFTLQKTANRVTSWQTTPDDTHYPSEKLVKDSLDGKQPLIDSTNKLDYSLIDNTPTIPTVPTISTNIQTDKSSTTKTAAPSAVYNEVHPATVSSQPVGGFAPNVPYILGTVTGTVTFVLASPSDANVLNHYYWAFDTGSTAPTITWPSGITWVGGSAPTINANKHYEVSVLNGIGAYIEA